MMTDNKEQIQYHSLNDIRARKESLRGNIEKDETRVKQLWDSLFTKPDVLSKNASTSKRLNSLLSIGISAFDGALFAWKIYRKFKKK